MKKIDSELRELCLSQPNQTIQVVIIGILTVEEVLELGLAPINGLNNFYKGKLIGRKILKLEKLDAIKSIEFDADMDVL